jgi:cytidine deaminase
MHPIQKRVSCCKWTNFFSSAYPSGLCAERVAIFQAGAIYPEAKIKNGYYRSFRLNKTIAPIPPAVLADNQ